MNAQIFCPQCNTLIMQAAACPACRWRRPSEREAEKGEFIRLAEFRSRAHSAPLVIDGLLYAGLEDGRILALDVGTGQERWSIGLAPWVSSTKLAYGDGLLYAGTEQQDLGMADKAVLALDALTGQERWRSTMPASCTSAPALADGHLYFTTGEGIACAIDAATGGLIWQVQLAGWDWTPSPPAVGQGLVCLGARGPNLVALHAADGSDAWRFQIPDGFNWLPAQPTLAGGICYVSAWDNCLYALDRADGRERWRFAGQRPALSSPVIHGSSVLFGAQDHRLYALTVESGQLLWHYGTEGRIFGAPIVIDGAACFGSSDGHLHQVDVETGMAITEPIPVEGGITSELVLEGRFLYVLTRRGRLYALALRAAEPILSAAEYEERRQWQNAAAAHAIAGDLIRAAQLYDRYLDLPFCAGQLYRAGGDSALAAVRFEAAGRLREARALYRQLDDHRNVARVSEELGDLQEAASRYERAKDYGRAAQLYERMGQKAKAAELYARTKHWQRARELFTEADEFIGQVQQLRSAGDLIQAAEVCERFYQYTQAADLYQESGDLLRAGDALMQMEDFHQAAELYEKADPPQRLKAASAYRKAGDLDQAIALYKAIRAWGDAATCYEEAGDLGGAALMLEEVAEQIEEESHGRNELQIADLYDQAASFHRREFDGDAAQRCVRRARYFRRQPLLNLTLEQQEHFVSGQANLLHIRLTNEGRQPAREITIELQPSLDGYLGGQLTRHISGMGRLQRRQTTLNVVANNPGPVIVDVILRYKDNQGVEFEDRIEDWPIEIRPERASTGFTPQQIVMVTQGGHYIQSGRDVRLVGGDLLEGHAQKGDRLEISRGQQVEAAPQPALHHCPGCGREQSSLARFCEDCGTELT